MKKTLAFSGHNVVIANIAWVRLYTRESSTDSLTYWYVSVQVGIGVLTEGFYQDEDAARARSSQILNMIEETGQ